MLRLTRDLPVGTGHTQASPAIDPHPATNTPTILSDQGKLQVSAQTPEVRQLFQIGTQHMHTPAQDPSFEADYEQTKFAMHPQPAINLKIISNDHENLQDSAQASEALQLLKPETLHMKTPPQNLPFKADQGQAYPEQLSLSTHYKQINSDEHFKQQGGVQTPGAWQASKTHVGSVLIKLQYMLPYRQELGQQQLSDSQGALQKKNFFYQVVLARGGRPQ